MLGHHILEGILTQWMRTNFMSILGWIKKCVMQLTAQTECYLDAGESDSWGGVGSNHQSNEGRPQVSKHVGELRKEQKQQIRFVNTQSLKIQNTADNLDLDLVFNISIRLTSLWNTISLWSWLHRLVSNFTCKKTKTLSEVHDVSALVTEQGGFSPSKQCTTLLTIDSLDRHKVLYCLQQGVSHTESVPAFEAEQRQQSLA